MVLFYLSCQSLDVQNYFSSSIFDVLVCKGNRRHCSFEHAWH